MNSSSAKLGDIAKVFNGKTPAESEQRQSGFPVLKIKDVDENGVFRGQFDSFVDEELANQFPEKQICVNDVMILNAAHNADYVASKMFFANERVAGALSTGEWLIIRADEDKVDPRFIHYWLQDSRTKYKLRLLVKGIHLYPKDVAELNIPLPPLTEQKRIASLLARADRLRSLRRTARDLGDSLLQSVFLEMFGEPQFNEKKWDLVTLGEKITFMTSGSRGWAEHYSDEGDLFLRIQNVGANQLLLDDVAYVQAPDTAESKRTRVQPGDLLISATADLGRTAVIPENFPTAYINQHLFLLRLKELNPVFVAGYFSTPSGKAQILRLDREGVKSGLNFDDARSLTVFNPPLNLQEEFASVVRRVEQMRARQAEGERQAENLFESLLAEGFGGETL